MVSLAGQHSRFTAPDLIVEGERGDVFGRAAVKLVDGGRRAHFVVPYSSSAEALTDETRSLTLTVLDDHRYATVPLQLGGARH
jgi:hypothetical protein